MIVEIREAVDSDKDIFIEFAIKLSNFNRKNHSDECKYDHYELVMNSITKHAEETFNSRNDDTSILIAELEGKPVGYALGRIFVEDVKSDNGTGRMGLFDELFLDETARGLGLGQKLLDETIKWMKEKGINRIKLHAYSWNHHAKRLYERNGFKEYAVSYETFI
ncbi:MAG TPA: GNAT family N-acetyltransferase [Pseudoneobacillus sp.]|nr:GNAT family N-acetyltransferase [Pseudoneobacillus sp.]